MITCRELAELLCDFLANELPPHHCEAIEQHLGFCQPCVHFVQSYQVTIQVTRRLSTPPLPEHLAQRLRELMDRELGA